MRNQPGSQQPSGGPLLKTCQTCFKAKIRCQTTQASGACDRCSRLQKTCIFASSRRRPLTVPGPSSGCGHSRSLFARIAGRGTSGTPIPTLPREHDPALPFRRAPRHQRRERYRGRDRGAAVITPTASVPVSGCSCCLLPRRFRPPAGTQSSLQRVSLGPTGKRQYQIIGCLTGLIGAFGLGTLSSSPAFILPALIPGHEYRLRYATRSAAESTALESPP